MKPPVFRRFQQANVPTAPTWITIILDPLNTFCEQCVALFDNGLTIEDNFRGMKYIATFQTDSNGNIKNLTFNYTKGGKPDTLLIGNLTNLDGTPLSGAYSMNGWSFNQGKTPPTITVNKIAGLDPNKQYKITLVAL